MAKRLKITDAALAKWKRDLADGEYLDTEVRGLGARVSPKGKIAFFLYVQLPGDSSSQRHALGEWMPPHFTLAHARSAATEWRANIGRGLNPKDEISKRKAEAARRKDETLDKVIPEWGAARVKAGRRSRATKWAMKDLYNHVSPLYGDRPLREITRSEIRQLLKGIGEKHPHMACKVHTTLSSVYRWAIEEELYGLSDLPNPCANISYGSYGYVRKSASRPLTAEEFAALPAAIEAACYPWGQLAHFLLLTAGRHGETKMARWSEIDFENRIWTAPPEHTKNGQECRRPLSDAAFNLLTSLPRNLTEVKAAMANASPWQRQGVLNSYDSDRIFGLRGGEFPSSVAAKRGFHRHMPEHLREWNWHWIRHTFRTIMSGHVEDGTVLEKAIELYLGHAERDPMQVIYNHHKYEKSMRKVAEVWAQEVHMRMHPSPKVVQFKKKA
jgi:integrase